MTKIEMKRKELDIIERMIQAVNEGYHWDCCQYDPENSGYVKYDDADPELVALYESWIAKLEKMI